MLKIENIYYRYKNSNRDVLTDVNADFDPGKLHSIVGPSGSGKTTMLSIMAGLDRPSKGSIAINGQNLADMDLDQYRRQSISMIFQAFQLFPLLNARENVCLPMQMEGKPIRDAQIKAESLLNSVGIDKTKHRRYPSNLSGGEQQRVAIARALGTGAKVILADEPTGNLDKANGEAVISILKNLAHEEGYCIIIVTHNLEVAEQSDSVYRMSDGILTKAG